MFDVRCSSKLGVRSALVHAEPRRRGGLKAVYDPAQSISQPRSAEVDQQPNRGVGEFEIGQELFGMRSRQVVNALDFNDNAVIHDKVHANEASTIAPVTSSISCTLVTPASPRLRVNKSTHHRKP